MPLLACGINYKTAPLAVREKIAFTNESLQKPLLELIEHPHVQEAAILSTCNRTEIYCATKSDTLIVDWLHKYHQLPNASLSPHVYLYENHAAVKHLLRVASGLDSMVLGEPEILGQIKSAYALANSAGTLGSHLNRLFQYVFSVTKKVRSETQITTNPVSIASSVVHLAQRIFADLAQKNVLYIGAGQTIRTIARHLSNAGVKQCLIANRNKNHAQELAVEFNGKALSLSEINEYLPKVDLVISATASPVPILGKGAVEKAIKARKHRIMFMVDLAVPRDIEPEIAAMDDVYLYSLDDLQKVIQQNLANRELAACAAESIIEAQAENYMRSLKLYEYGPTIKDFRAQAEMLRDKELAKMLMAVQLGTVTPEEALQRLAVSLTNKLLHHPTLELRKSALDCAITSLSS